MTEFELQVSENAALKGLAWKLEEPKGCIVIFEGMEEHVSRYDEFARFLNVNGYSVYALDTYGQGLNGEGTARGVWPRDGFLKQVQAHNALVEKLKAEGHRVFIFAHSMGSFMGQDYIQRYPGSVEKIVLCGSGYKVPAKPVALLLAKICSAGKRREKKAGLLNSMMFGVFQKKIKDPETEYDWLSWNKDNVKRYLEDPLCGFGPNNGFCYEFILGMSRLFTKKGLARIDRDQHIFLISGDGDPVTAYGKYTAKLLAMYKGLGVTDITARVYAHMRHEILNETDRQTVYYDVLQFFDK